MESLSVLEDRLQRWSVPNDVREAVRQATAAVAREGTPLVEAAVGDRVALAVRGQPVAVYVSASQLSVALDPDDAARAHRSDSAFGLDREGETTWLVHCRYGRLDPSRLGPVTALMERALRRHAPRPEPRPATTRTRRGVIAADRSATGSTKKPAARRSRSEEDRRTAAAAAVPRCPVPGCNLPMVGGSCGFHD